MLQQLANLAVSRVARVEPMALDDLVGDLDTCAVTLRAVSSDRGAGDFWNLTAIATLARVRAPRRIFEIGTGRGRSALNLAANAPDDAVLYTLDLPGHATAGVAFRDQPEARKIRQLRGDSRSFAFDEFAGTFDLVLVDGGHDYQTVMHDSRTAFRLIRPSGWIVWDDLSIDWPGVTRAIRAVAQTARVRWIKGTSLAVYIP